MKGLLLIFLVFLIKYLNVNTKAVLTSANVATKLTCVLDPDPVGSRLFFDLLYPDP